MVLTEVSIQIGEARRLGRVASTPAGLPRWGPRACLRWSSATQPQRGQATLPNHELLPLVRFLQGASQLAPGVFQTIFLISMLLAFFVNAGASTFEEYEGRLISSIEITFEGSPPDPSAEAEFLSIIGIVPNSEFSAVSIRKSLQDLFNSERVANAR